jgi:hypothetical protein
METIKYAHESCGIKIWRCPAETEKYRPDFSSGISKLQLSKNNQSEKGKI